MKKMMFALLVLLASSANAEMVKCARNHRIFLQNYPCATVPVETVAAAPVEVKNAFKDPTQPPDGVATSTGDFTEQSVTNKTAENLKAKAEFDKSLAESDKAIELGRRTGIDTTQLEKKAAEGRAKSLQFGNMIEKEQRLRAAMQQTRKERVDFVANAENVIKTLQSKLDKPASPLSRRYTPNTVEEKYEEGISLSPLIIKKDHLDSIGYQWIAYKVTVRNDTDESRKVYLCYKGIDNAGFKVDDIILIGTIPAHSSKTLTNDHAMKPSELIRIHEWVFDK